ncbi:MAG: type II toxin-antitoxin system prevent-host-death family antitoxin [Propionibacteriaceae bacterium]|nr:type II toxin-antitoxin system prevent-host-death family antitoxin [Propionibacteriaceae bacterium]
MSVLIAQKELRNDIGSVLRRVEAGETMTVTVAGRPVAELRPASRRTWVTGPALRDVWSESAPPRGMEEDIASMNGELTDPFSE